jgi:hypothetical protein
MAALFEVGLSHAGSQWLTLPIRRLRAR